MKAIAYDDYGGPEVLTFRDLPDPEPGDGDVLIEVHAASVNPLDWKIREGMMRQSLELPFPFSPGRDFSGVVRATGSNVSAFAPGDEVYGTAERGRQGTQAELLANSAGFVARNPPSLSHVEAASLPIAGLTALTALADVAPVEAGSNVLIHAGAGGVGSIGVQIAAHRGATVTATASAANAEFVRGLGAERVIDYRTEDVAAEPPEFDLVFDTMGGAVHTQSFAALKPGGILVYIHAAPIDGAPPRDDVEVRNSMVDYSTAQLDRMTALVEDGAISPWIREVFALENAVEAHRLCQTGHARGKIVVRVR